MTAQDGASSAKMPHMKTFPSTPPSSPFRAMREATGLSQRELERRLGWGSGWLSQLEHGYRNPEREAALKVLLGRLLVNEH